ncbi:MAG: DUF262 domain-containing protein [Candidatus Anammoxibacter sp.]
MGKTKFAEKKLDAILKQVNKNSGLYDYRTKDYPFEVICKKYGEEEDLSSTLYVPDYQRGFVWKPDKQSKFIESVLLGVPLTPFLVSEDKDSRLEIIDGSQRIRTLIAFYENRLILRKLKNLTEINTAKFKDLPLKLQNYIKNRDFRVIVVDNAEVGIRQDIFERINTTSETLTDAQIRKGSYSGKFYNLILELKKNKDFRTICPVTHAKEKLGEYEELILRFFAYCDKYQEFKHDVAIFLNDYLNEMNEISFDKKQYQKKFHTMVDFIRNNYPVGFCKEKNRGSTPRVRFEAIAVGTYLAINETPDLENPNLGWLKSEGFKIQTTSDASNNPGRLKNRIEFVRDGLLSKLNNDRLQNG